MIPSRRCSIGDARRSFAPTIRRRCLSLQPVIGGYHKNIRSAKTFLLTQKVRTRNILWHSCCSAKLLDSTCGWATNQPSREKVKRRQHASKEACEEGREEGCEEDQEVVLLGRACCPLSGPQKGHPPCGCPLAFRTWYHTGSRVHDSGYSCVARCRSSIASLFTCRYVFWWWCAEVFKRMCGARWEHSAHTLRNLCLYELTLEQ